jgi:hypothetical protein
MELMELPIIDRVNDIFEELRLGGNTLMSLVRDVENRLNVAEENRIPSF